VGQCGADVSCPNLPQRVRSARSCPGGAVDETRFFIDLGLLFLAALGGAVLAFVLRQPLIVGYVLGGVVVGPFTPGPTIADPHVVQLFAEIVGVLLMFSIGVEVSFPTLLGIGRTA